MGFCASLFNVKLNSEIDKPEIQRRIRTNKANIFKKELLAGVRVCKQHW